ncbi:MAG: hypothetical protein HZR80_12960 [Candidatus Heimdallarchaeota archaeon]
MQSFQNEINNFLKSITEVRKKSTTDLLRIDENTIAMVGLQSIKVLTIAQKEMVELICDNPRTGAQLAKLTNKTPQFISKIMKTLVKYGIVDHIEAPFGPSKFYILKANLIGEEEIGKVKEEALPKELQGEIDRRGVFGNLMSLSFREILDMIKELNEKEKQKVLDFIIEYCQVEGA